MTGNTPKSSDSGQKAISSVDKRIFSGESLAEVWEMPVEFIQAVYSLAYQQYANGLYEKALKSFGYLCIYDNWNPRNFIGQAACLKMMKLYENAIQAYLQAYSLDRSQPDPLVQIADCALSLNDIEGAKDGYLAAIEVAGRLDIHSQEVKRAHMMLRKIGSEEAE